MSNEPVPEAKLAQQPAEGEKEDKMVVCVNFYAVKDGYKRLRSLYYRVWAPTRLMKIASSFASLVGVGVDSLSCYLNGHLINLATPVNKIFVDPVDPQGDDNKMFFAVKGRNGLSSFLHKKWLLSAVRGRCRQILSGPIIFVFYYYRWQWSRCASWSRRRCRWQWCRCASWSRRRCRWQWCRTARTQWAATGSTGSAVTGSFAL